MYKFNGQLRERSEIQEVGKTTKLEFVIHDNSSKWENFAKFEIYGDNIQKVKDLNLNDKVEVTFNVRGRQYNGKFYTNLVAFNITKENNSNNQDLPF